MTTSATEPTVDEGCHWQPVVPRLFLVRLARGRRTSVLPVILRLFLSACAVGVAFGAQADEGRQLEIELNKLEPNGDACRAFLVLENGTDRTFMALKLDLVMFDTDGIVAKRLAVQAAPLADGKTSLKVFDIDGLPCERVGRLLLNDVMACSDAGGARSDCLGLISASTRGAVPFIK